MALNPDMTERAAAGVAPCMPLGGAPECDDAHDLSLRNCKLRCCVAEKPKDSMCAVPPICWQQCTERMNAEVANDGGAL
jgi:hypothetical protein